MKTRLFSFLLLLILSSCTRGEREIVIVPKNFKGYILVIYNQKDGSPIEYEGKKRVYKIPQDGILRTQFAGNYGWTGFTEFYYEKIAHETKLSSYAEIGNVPVDTIAGFMGASGTIRKEVNNEERVEFREFYIGTRSEIEEAQEKAEKLDILKLAE